MKLTSFLLGFLLPLVIVLTLISLYVLWGWVAVIVFSAFYLMVFGIIFNNSMAEYYTRNEKK